MDFLDADSLAGKDCAEIDFLSAETNAATVCDDDRAVVKRVVDARQSSIGTRRSLVDFRRTLHVQGFMWPLVVEDLDEVIEACLLLQEVASGRSAETSASRGYRWSDSLGSE